MKAILENPETTTIGRIKNVLLGLFVIIIWVAIINNLLQFITGEARIVADLHLTLSSLFFSCIMAPITEEIMFRLLPLTIVKGMSKSIIIATVLASSTIFGFMHHNGYVSVLYQGFMGFIFACVYIKNGYNYWSSVLIHSLWNLLCFLHPF